MIVQFYDILFLGQRQALCVGKPTLPTIPTGQPPIGPSKPPTQSPGNGTGTGNIGATDKPVTTIDPKNGMFPQRQYVNHIDNKIEVSCLS